MKDGSGKYDKPDYAAWLFCIVALIVLIGYPPIILKISAVTFLYCYGIQKMAHQGKKNGLFEFLFEFLTDNVVSITVMVFMVLPIVIANTNVGPRWFSPFFTREACSFTEAAVSNMYTFYIVCGGIILGGAKILSIILLRYSKVKRYLSVGLSLLLFIACLRLSCNINFLPTNQMLQCIYLLFIPVLYANIILRIVGAIMPITITETKRLDKSKVSWQLDDFSNYIGCLQKHPDTILGYYLKSDWNIPEVGYLRRYRYDMNLLRYATTQRLANANDLRMLVEDIAKDFMVQRAECTVSDFMEESKRRLMKYYDNNVGLIGHLLPLWRGGENAWIDAALDNVYTALLNNYRKYIDNKKSYVRYDGAEYEAELDDGTRVTVYSGFLDVDKDGYIDYDNSDYGVFIRSYILTRRVHLVTRIMDTTITESNDDDYDLAVMTAEQIAAYLEQSVGVENGIYRLRNNIEKIDNDIQRLSARINATTEPNMFIELVANERDAKAKRIKYTLARNLLISKRTLIKFNITK